MQRIISRFLLAASIATAFCIFASAQTQPAPSGLFFQPGGGATWDPTVIYANGKYYMFTMYHRDSVFLATSADGVHWQDYGVVLKAEGFKNNRVIKQYVAKVGDKYIMDYGAFADDNSKNNLLRFYESSDLLHWTHLYDVPIDPQFYRTDGRWDHMFMIPKDDKSPAGGCWGYVVADPIDHGGVGMMDSADCIHYKPIKAPEITADFRIPTMEEGGIKKIGNKYYLIGGNVNHYGFSGYGVYTFVSDSPTGPFHPDLDAYRLTGTSGMEDVPYVHVLACFVKDSPEDLVSDPFTFGFGGETGVNGVDGKGTWFLPMRKAIVDPQGHLRLAYWKQNDLAKGNAIEIDTAKNTVVFPPGQTESTSIVGVHNDSSSIAIDTNNDWSKFPWLAGNGTKKAVVVFDQKFDLNKGIVVEGKINARALLNRMQMNPYGDARNNYAGFFIEGKERGTGTGIMLQVGGPQWRASKIGHVSFGTTFNFETQDVTGPPSATVTGLDDGKDHTFRLWLRGSQVELYIDDLLMQSFFFSTGSGRIGFITQEGETTYSDLKVYELNL